MNTPMEEVEHDVFKLEDEGQSTIIENDELNLVEQQEFEVEYHDEIVRSKDSVFTLIEIGVRVGVNLDVEEDEELNLELSESVEELTHFPIIGVEEPTKKLNEHIYF
ncbi:hypothetical protein J1N35_014280 [Gossypium stocksii]|uniref:Uncharacterized protein n=1 Tax=Gossypium stocksii TaxID=47602 RepID=A0A9D3VW38_9ROSI|nr:hypothetical protein J1N35_014280 [Gossypium stocksii]